MPYLAALLVGVGLLAVFAGQALRVAGAGGETGGAAAATSIEAFIDRITRPFIPSGGATSTAETLTRAGIGLRPQEWYALRIFGPVVALLAVYLVRQDLLVGVLVAAVAYAAPGRFLSFRRDHRGAALIRQLPDAMAIMSNSLEGGAALLQAIQAVAETLPPPIGEELARVLREVELGFPLDEALDHFAARVGSREAAMFVTAMQINRMMGGSLVELLSSISETMRARVQMVERARVLTAQARTSGYIVTALPFIVALLLLLIAPKYMAPLFTTALGYLALLLVVILVGIAYLMMSRITDVRA